VFDDKDRLLKTSRRRIFQFLRTSAQEITIFKQEDVPVSLGLVIDNSGSMRTKRERVNKAATTFVRTCKPQDEIFLINFNDQVYIDQEFTRNKDDLAETLDTIDTRGGTALHDALYLSLEQFAKARRQKGALHLDGEDRDSRYKFNSV
jgi:VWFA-related protein